MKNIFYIVGIKHCGKSTIGRELAINLNIPFFDLDKLIEDSTGLSVREYYIENGKQAFQKQEVSVLTSLINGSLKTFVCATGGGICDNSEAMHILGTGNKKIFINTSCATIYSRIIINGIPPFLKSDNPKKEFYTLYNSRTKLYKNLNNMEINGDNKTPEEIKKEILNLIKEPEIARK